MNTDFVLTDTHTHLYSEEFAEDRTEMIERAIKKGKTFFIPAIDHKVMQKMYDLEQQFPGQTFLMMGLHQTLRERKLRGKLAHVEAAR